ncbi:hypothetical protein cand_028910 [Cryptosporidium andersoni]|uniref:Uncharacterized protein n=1 Tax=Cryptosporidium andersoni TaxID=117008 RepID=A0A1J4MNT5_9CRYT|nr:hypothetical protein cand_028910 [Cryptosporidium andersoni]
MNGKSRYQQILDAWIGKYLDLDNNKCVGVVSSIPKVTDLLNPLSDMDNFVYLNIMEYYQRLLAELRIRLIEVFNSTSKEYGIQYKLDVADERMLQIKELGEKVYSLNVDDIINLKKQDESDENLLIEKLIPINDIVGCVISEEENLFLKMLHSKSKCKLEKIQQRLLDSQAKLEALEDNLKNVQESSNNFVLETIETFHIWSNNATKVISAVQQV